MTVMRTLRSGRTVEYLVSMARMVTMVGQVREADRGADETSNRYRAVRQDKSTDTTASAAVDKLM